MTVVLAGKIGGTGRARRRRPEPRVAPPRRTAHGDSRGSVVGTQRRCDRKSVTAALCSAPVMAPRKIVALAALSALSTLLLMYSSHGGGGLLGGGGGGEAASTGLVPAPAPPLAPVPTAAPPYTAAPGPVPVPQPGPAGSGSGAAPPPPPPPTAAAPGSAGVALAEPPPPLPPATEATPASAGAGAALAEPVEGCNPRIAPAPDQMRPLRWLFYQTQVHHKKTPFFAPLYNENEIILPTHARDKRRAS